MPVGGSGGGTGGASASNVKAGGAYIEIFARDGPLNRALDRAKKRVEQFGKLLGSAGKAALVGGGALMAPLTALFTGGIGRAAELDKLSRKFGVPIEMLHRFKHAADLTGASIEEVIEHSDRFADVLASAPAADAASIKAAAQSQREWNAAIIAAQDALLPLAKHLTPILQNITQWIRANPQFVTGLMAGAGALLGLGVALTAASVGLKLVLVLTSPLALKIGLITAAVAGLSAAWAMLTPEGQAFTDSLKTSWEGLTAAIGKGDLQTAWKIVLATLEVGWRSFVLTLQRGWNAFKGFFVDGWHDAIKLVRLLWNNFEAFAGKTGLRIAGFLVENFHGVFRGFLLAAAEAVGPFNENLAAEFRRTADLTKKSLGAGLKAEEKLNEQRRQENENQIEKDARNAQEARDKARADDLRKAQEELDAARKQLGDLTAGAKGGLFGKALLGAAGGALGALAGLGSAAQLVGSTKGTFSGPLGQQLGIGVSWQQTQKTLLEKIRDNTADTNRQLQNLDGAVLK